VFYYLVSGVTGEEKVYLKLGTVNEYRYLQCLVRRQGVDEREPFDQLKRAFKVVGLSTRLVAQVCQLIATILHIGNLQFSGGGEAHEGAIVSNHEVLATVAEFLGVTQEALAEILSFKTVLLRKEVCTTFLDPEQAEQVRDGLARTLYSLLFSWLNEHINQKLCKDSFGSFIAILDLPGSQNNAGPTSGVNSVDQFCFNFANEKLHNWMMHRIHETPLEEAAKEKLPMSRLPYFDNSECLRMLSESKAGAIRIMDDQATKKRSEASFLEAMGKRYTGHSSFSLGNADRNGASSFTINHYSGAVTYSAENFLERNANETSADILRLLRGSNTGSRAITENQGSNNPFIKSLFSNKSIATQAHPRNDETIVAAQQPVRPMRAPSTRRRKGRKLPFVNEEGRDEADDEVGGGNEGDSAGKELQCVAGQHWAALSTLLSTFDQAQPWFVFCLRPNDSQLPSQIETRSVKAQIRSFGLTDIALRLQTTYEVRMTHGEACERYAEEFSVRTIPIGPSHLDRLQDLKRVLKLSDVQMAIGDSLVSPFRCEDMSLTCIRYSSLTRCFSASRIACEQRRMRIITAPGTALRCWMRRTQKWILSRRTPETRRLNLQLSATTTHTIAMAQRWHYPSSIMPNRFVKSHLMSSMDVVASRLAKSEVTSAIPPRVSGPTSMHLPATCFRILIINARKAPSMPIHKMARQPRSTRNL